MQERTGKRTAYLLTNWCGNEKPDLHLSKIMCSPDGFCDREVVVVPTGTEGLWKGFIGFSAIPFPGEAIAAGRAD
jgi:hypothetical protein